MPTLTDRPTVGQSPITGRQTIMATTTIPRTPAEITARFGVARIEDVFIELQRRDEGALA